MINKNRKIAIICLISAAILVVIDQIIKSWVFDNLKEIGLKKLFPGFLNLRYVENRGAAFGILQGHTVLLSVISAIFLIIIVVYILMGKIEQTSILISVSLILAGGVGNIIDRISRGFVIDYLDFDISFLKTFPVFNFADCCVVVGALLLLIFSFVPLFNKKEESA